MRRMKGVFHARLSEQITVPVEIALEMKPKCTVEVTIKPKGESEILNEYRTEVRMKFCDKLLIENAVLEAVVDHLEKVKNEIERKEPGIAVRFNGAIRTIHSLVEELEVP